MDREMYRRDKLALARNDVRNYKAIVEFLDSGISIQPPVRKVLEDYLETQPDVQEQEAILLYYSMIS